MFPDLSLNLGIAGVLSLVLGVGMVILLDSFDTTVRDPEQIHRLYQTDLLGALPIVKDTTFLTTMQLPPAPGESTSVVSASDSNGRDRCLFSKKQFEC